MSFYVGQKVTMIYDRKFKQPFNEVTSKFGIVYTVRGVMGERETALRFEEIRNKSNIYQGSDSRVECSFVAKHFRPVVDRKTDISIFTKMLNPNKELCIL